MHKEDVLYMISKIQLIKESTEFYNVICRLIEMDGYVSSMVSISLIPFSSFILDGIITLNFQNDRFIKNYLDISDDEFKKVIKKLRVGHKLLSDKKESKIYKNIKNIQKYNHEFLTKDYNYIQNTFIKLLGQEDYSIYYYKNIEFESNIKSWIYLTKIFNKNPDNKEDVIKNLSQSISATFQEFICSYSDYITFNRNSNFKNIDKKNFLSKDYFLFDERRKNIFNNNQDVKTQVLLHSHLCQLNYLYYVFPNIFYEGFDSLFRFRFLSFLETIKVLRNTLTIINTSTENYILLKELSDSYVYKILSKTNVRNNLAHYLIQGYDSKIFLSYNSTIKCIIEYESKENFDIFYKKFDEEYCKLKILLKNILF